MLKYKEIKIEKSEMRKFMLEQYKTEASIHYPPFIINPGTL